MKKKIAATGSPGDYLKSVLEEKGIKNVELAVRMGRSAQYVTDIIKGHKAFDVELAIEISKALDESPTPIDFMAVAVKHLESTSGPSRSEILKNYDYAEELVKLKWVDGSTSPEMLNKQLSDFWSLKDKVANFRQSKSRFLNPDARRAWAIQVYRKAQEQRAELPKYDKSKLPELYTTLQALMDTPEGVAEVPKVLAQFGIAFVALKNPSKCPVDGVGNENDGAPYVGMSLRIARLDTFWFTLMHELKHIELEHKNVIPDTIDVASDDNPDEVRANEGAAELLISASDYDDFVFDGDFTLKAIQAKSNALERHPSILIGRLKRDHILDWSRFAREHPSIRELVLNDK